MWIVIAALIVTVLFFTGVIYLMYSAMDEGYDMGGWDYDDDAEQDEHGRV